jgi:hypothetical protein
VTPIPVNEPARKYLRGEVDQPGFFGAVVLLMYQGEPPDQARDAARTACIQAIQEALMHIIAQLGPGQVRPTTNDIDAEVPTIEAKVTKAFFDHMGVWDMLLAAGDQDKVLAYWVLVFDTDSAKPGHGALESNFDGYGGRWQLDYDLLITDQVTEIETEVAPGIASLTDGVLLLATDLNGVVHTNRIVLGQAAQGWIPIPGDVRTDCAAAAALAGNAPYMFVAVRGLDGYVHINQGGVDQSWVGWGSDYTLQTNFAPAVVSLRNGVLFLAADLDGIVHTNRAVLGEAAQGWLPIPELVPSDGGPAAALPPIRTRRVSDSFRVISDSLMVAIRGFSFQGQASTLFTNQGGADNLGFVEPWVGWEWDTLGNTFETNIAPAMATVPGGLVVLASDLNGVVNTKRVILGSGVEGWFPIPGDARTNVSPAGAAVGHSEYMFVAVTGPDRRVHINQGDLGHGWVGWQ